MSIDDVFGLMERYKLGFDAETRRGIIIVSEDTAETGHLGYISIAPTRALAVKIESEFEDLLEPAIQEEDAAGISHLARILSHLPPVRQESGDRATRDARALLREGAQKP